MDKLSKKSMRWVVGSFIIFLIVLAGCTTNSVPPAPPTDTTPTVTVTDSVPLIESAPGDPVILCNASDAHENEECFEDAFATCQRAVGTFWETSDGAALTFETQGLDEGGNCLVRVTVFSDSTEETQFAGQSATCSVPKSPAMGEHTEPFFDSYLIGPSTCVGTYVDAIQKDFEEPADDSPDNSTPEPPVAEPDSPEPVSFTVLVNEGGVDGVSEFTVQKGATVTLTITVDVKDVSFNGEQIMAPAQKGLAADQYIFNTGHLPPGQSKTVTFVANESFEFGVYWPGPSVLKGKGKFTVVEN